MLHRSRSGNNDRFGGNYERIGVCRRINFFADQIVDWRGAIQNCAGAENGAALNNCSFVDAAISTDENFVFNNYRESTDGLENSANLRGGAEVAIASDLRTTSDQRVRVNERAFIHIRTNINEHW